MKREGWAKLTRNAPPPLSEGGRKTTTRKRPTTEGVLKTDDDNEHRRKGGYFPGHPILGMISPSEKASLKTNITVHALWAGAPCEVP